MMALLAMAWDGQWFLKVYEEFDWETAARLNARVRAAFGRIEMRRMLRALGKPAADDVEDGVRIILTYFQEVLAAGFDADFTVEGDRVQVTIIRCAALLGCQRAGLERYDQACMACQGLWQAYFEVLLPHSPVRTRAQEMMGHGASRCHILIDMEGRENDERLAGENGFQP
ncbi:MAG TPA: hypothetical protein ENN99_01985 [Chloroflexi bacterium]|nr:hypothetical protein [Chloroflexota bacterium]